MSVLTEEGLGWILVDVSVNRRGVRLLDSCRCQC